jgi:GT2 family glycosyltransferase
MKGVPVLVLNWNGWQDTFACLQALRQEPEAEDIWLIDNGSEIDRSAEARAILPEIRILRWDDNYGWSGGYNRALKIAVQEGYEFAYLLNNDCKVTHDFLQPVVAAMSDDRFAAMGSRIAYEDPAGFVKFDGEYYLPGEQPLHETRGLRLVRTVNGAGMLIRLQALEQDGYIDERFFCYGEEEDWCWRMIKRGWKVGICEESVVIHRGEGSDVNANARYYRIRNEFLSLERFERRLRWRERLRLAGLSLWWAFQARREGRHEECLAMLCGLEDGLRGRFGKRRAERPRSVYRLLARAW